MNMHESMLLKALGSGAFDPDWYMRKYGLVFESDAAAFNDYLRKSKHSWVDPSPLFSTKKYFRSHFAALQKSRSSPLEHFLANEGRDEYILDNSSECLPEALIKADRLYRGSFSCAITAHIFYQEYIQILAECLFEFPFGIDVFLAVSTAEMREEAVNAISRLDCVNNLIVRVVPNRGRNFGPLLVEYGRMLMNYDIFCHVHSKKSLFSGCSQDAWGSYLFEYLLRDKQIVLKALAIFEDDIHKGLYFPTAFSRSLPKWACHTLKNKQSMAEVGSLLSLNEIKHGFISYPVGGMFWAKTEALKTLLDRDWSYDDFPEEPIPHDGTNLHAIERLLTAIVESNGYNEFVFVPEIGGFTSDRSHMTKEYTNNRGDLGYIVNNESLKILSFDVFDTICFRKNSYPDQGKEDMSLFVGCHQPHDFIRIRNDSEYELRAESGFAGDVSILDIYKRIKQKVNIEYSEENLANYEFQADLKYLLPKKSIVEAINQACFNGKTVYICTDTYYTKEQIRMILDVMKVPDEVRLFVSSSICKRKDNGSMWEYIKSLVLDAGCDPLAEFMHIGDNVVSDAQMAGDYGLGNYHILSPFEKWNAVSVFKLQEADLRDPVLRAKYGPLIAAFGSDPFL